MRITRMKTNHLTEPLGFDTRVTVFSYTVEDAQGLRQQAARIQLAVSPSEEAAVLDTGLVENVYDGDGRLISGIDNAAWQLDYDLQPRTRYWWRVYVLTDAGEEAWSGWTWFETAKAVGEAWAGKPVTSPMGGDVHPVFTRRFTADEACEARLYVIGLGLYEVYLNGKKVGDEVLLPGLHAYDMWHQYQTMALQVPAGDNTLEIWLGDGWLKGRYGTRKIMARKDRRYGLLAELHLLCSGGTETVIGTDESWQVTRSPILLDGIYDGETIDMNVQPGEAQYAVPTDCIRMKDLLPRLSPYIRIQETRPLTVVSTDPLILDAGQNMAGWVRFRCRAPKGTEIRLLHGELVREGDLYQGNLRTAKATFAYVSDGEERLVQPRFTYFGFRYVKVEGWQGEFDPADFEACVIYSDMERTGWVETSDPMINRLFENALWSQKGNFIDVPTDCPQRDERMGWTGDAQIFCDTAMFNMDAAAFFRKFMYDLSVEQTKYDGQPPCVVPGFFDDVAGAAVWGDSATVIPWQVYLHSGDPSVLKVQYRSMKAWVDYITRQNEKAHSGGLWSSSAQYGDWLALDGDNVHGGTDRTYIATAYYYYSADIVARSAGILGLEEDAEKYAALTERIRSDFLQEYYTPTGRLAVSTQTGYVMALYLGLYPDGARERVAGDLRRKIAEDGGLLQTGFVGTPWLLPALTEGGSNDVAYRLLLRREYPGWLYAVDRGATTIWERWNSIEPDGSMNRDGMNSLNHYTYGSVAAWMYRCMGGVEPAEDAPGFRRAILRPRPERAVKACRAQVLTPHGLISTAWRWKGENTLSLDVTVPFGTAAKLILPDGSGERTLEAGAYHFDLQMPAAHPFSLLTNWRELIACPEGQAMVDKHFSRPIERIAFHKELHTVEQLLQSPFAEATLEQIEALRQDLEKL